MSLGPFSLRVSLAAAAVLLAWIVAGALARRRKLEEPSAASGLLLDAVIAGFVAARLGYILQWWPEYRAAPLSMLALGDGGFAWWAGLPVALLVLWWRSRKARAGLRLPALGGLAAGLLAWALVLHLGTALRQSVPPLPDLELETLAGEPQRLDAYLGRPIVVNLWATWCPPCRREMPVLAHAQQQWPEVALLLVNQGDERHLVDDFLARSGLELRNVLLDPASRTMQASGARVLPTTLFFDAQGRLLDTHVGELSRAALADRLQRRYGLAPRQPRE